MIPVGAVTRRPIVAPAPRPVATALPGAERRRRREDRLADTTLLEAEVCWEEPEDAEWDAFERSLGLDGPRTAMLLAYRGAPPGPGRRVDARA